MAEKEKNFSAEEREAMQATAKEARTRRSRAKKSPEELRAAGEADIKEAIEKLTPEDQALAKKLHDLVSEVAPDLNPKTWYGFPSYARDDKVVVFYQPASKFDTRYGTVTFQQDAALDDGDMWAVSFAVVNVTDAVEKKIRSLVKKAAG